jgi:tetratricopeptide (TPR) repeat protein
MGPASTTRYQAIAGTLQAFREAVALHDRGRLGEAEQRYESVLRADGHHFQALCRLGLIRLQQGRFDDAVGLFRRALKVERRSAYAHLHLGAALAGIKNHEEAIRHYKKALALEPDAPEIHSNMGHSFQALGRVEQAIAHFEKALAVNPRHAEANINLGTALAVLGRHTEAIPRFQAAIAIKPNSVEAHKSLAKVLDETDHYSDAAEHYEKVLALCPNDAEARTGLGDVLHRLDRPDEAIEQYENAAEHYEKVLDLRPHDAEARTGLGDVLHRLDRPDEAIEQYQKALAAAPTFSKALNRLGNALHLLGQSEEAVAYFRRALALDSSDLKTNKDLGTALIALGRFDEARAFLEKATALSPHKAGCYEALVRYSPVTLEDRHFAAMRKLAANPTSLSEIEQIDLHFALGKAFADVGEHQQSFDHILAANALKRRQIKFDEGKSLEQFERIRNVFTSQLLRDKAGRGDPSDLPIFIFGMPRSGTTLIEQILASHPKVFGAGELRGVQKLAARIRGPEGPSFPDVVPKMSADELRRFGAGYIEAVRGTAAQAARITDKMLGNFVFAGLLHLALPNARMIHARRDLRDVAFSCFSVHFEMGHKYTYDLAELGRYCRAYAQLMQHWQTVLPEGAILEVRYEELVADLEHQARRIVAHCGLEWDDACLSFYKTERSVRTASAAQVRRPIYQSSIGRWRPHEVRLQPLLKELEACPLSPGT